jgi:molecular chaperone DnaK
VHSTEKNLKEYGDKIGSSEKTEIEQNIEAVKAAKDGEDADALRNKIEGLTAAAMKLGEAIYKQQQEGAAAGDAGAQTAGAGSGSTANDEKVVDADFEEVKDDKKAAS